jgi:hypothetical protein
LDGTGLTYIRTPFICHVAELADSFTEILPEILVGEKDLKRTVLYRKIAWQEIKDGPETQF